jgi:hypothetical protein
MLTRSAFKPRHRNSGRQHEGKRFPAHLAWLRKRACILAGQRGHVCEGKIEAAHFDGVGGKGVSLKVADFYAFPACSAAHSELHRIGQETWQERWRISLASAVRSYAKASPHRHEWEADHV